MAGCPCWEQERVLQPHLASRLGPVLREKCPTLCHIPPNPREWPSWCLELVGEGTQSSHVAVKALDCNNCYDCSHSPLERLFCTVEGKAKPVRSLVSERALCIPCVAFSPPYHLVPARKPGCHPSETEPGCLAVHTVGSFPFLHHPSQLHIPHPKWDHLRDLQSFFRLLSPLLINYLAAA